MNKTVLELINEAYGNYEPDPNADSSGYGFDSEFNEPVNAVDTNNIMEPENIAAVYFTESDSDNDEPICSDEEENLLFDYETSESISPETNQDLSAYFTEDMIDISTMGKKSDGEIPPGGIMDEQDFSPPGNVPVSSTGGIGSEVQKIINTPEELSPNEMGIDKNMSVEDALKENYGFGLVEALISKAFDK